MEATMRGKGLMRARDAARQNMPCAHDETATKLAADLHRSLYRRAGVIEVPAQGGPHQRAPFRRGLEWVFAPMKMLSSNPIEKTARRRSKRYGAPIYSLRAQMQHDGVKNSLAIKLPAPRPIGAIVRNVA